MEKIVVKNYKEFGEQLEIPALVIMGDDKMEVSDGYHTFGELYEHRITLFITLCHQINHYVNKSQVWRSKLHHDSSSFEGWFILGINKEYGFQITYHLPLSKWEETNFAETLEKSPEWDGHTSEDVLKRLKALVTP